MLNLVLLRKVWLKDDELPILVVRTSLWARFWSLSLAAVLILGAFFLMYFLWRWGWIGVLIFSLMLTVAVIIIARVAYQYYFTVWILTNMRLIDIYQRGFFGRDVTEAVYDKISEVYGRSSGRLGGLLGLGDIYVGLTASKAKLKLAAVRGSGRAVSEIILQQEEYCRNLAGQKEHRAEQTLSKIRKRLGEKEYSRLLGD